MRVADHGKQRQILIYAIDSPAGVKYLVPAMLGIGLSKHHQLYIVGISAKVSEGLHQIIDFIIGQRQTELTVGAHQRLTALAQHINLRHGGRLGMGKQLSGLLHFIQDGLGHLVVQVGIKQYQLIIAQRAFDRDMPFNAALQAGNVCQTTIADNVSRLARPGRDGARARHNQPVHALGTALRFFCHVAISK